MKKKLLIILLISIFFLTGCKNKQEESLKKQEDTVREELKDINNISINKLRENYEYLKNNYEKINDKDTFTKVAYSVKFIQSIGVFEEKNELEILADNATKYLKKNNKENLENLKKSFNRVDGKEEVLFAELYNSYMKNEVVKNLIISKKELVEADINDKNILREETINSYYAYIENHINKPFANNEIIEYLVYYSLYFKDNKTDTLLTKLGISTIDYLQTLDNEKLIEIQDLIRDINKNPKSVINSFINQAR